MHPFLIAVLVTFLACAWLSPNARAQSEPLGFLERFALSDQRTETLQELIPNTPDYFFYQVLHAQNEGRVAQARALLDEWIAKHGENELTKRMKTRQFLFEYASNPNQTIQHLQQEFQIPTSHPAPKKDEAAELATRLDQELIAWKRLVQETVKNSGVDLVEDPILGDVLGEIGNIDQLRKWFSRSHRIDSPKLIDRLVEELTTIHSLGFGWAPIHRELTLPQLEELQKRIPSLNQNGNFVVEVLRRYLPSEDESLQDPAVRRRQLDQLETYALTLPEVHNSLIASILYQRLNFDLEQGTPDRERFKRYLRIPNQRSICSPNYRDRNNGKPQIDWNATYPVRFLDRPIGNDMVLIEKYLDLFFQTDANVDDFADWIDRGYLQTFFAKTKILHGIGDPKTYYAQLSPEAQKELAERIEVRFAPNNQSIYKNDDRVRLILDLKNTPELIVRIYRLNARNVLAKQMAPISTAIDLDGVVPNVERKLAYAQKSDRRHRETIEFPELEGMGIWIVEVLAGGQRSRALIQKGQLHSLQSVSDAGQLIRIVNAEGEHVPSARVQIREREFEPDEDGWIVIPFEQATQFKSILLVDGNFAVLESFQHLGEEYQLLADFLVDPQSVLSGNRSAVVIRPQLLTHNQPIALSNLRDIELIANSIDLEGISTTQVFPKLALNHDRELTLEFNVPPRLSAIEWTLKGTIKEARTGTDRTLVATHRTQVNDFTKTAWVQDAYLNRTIEGFRLEMRGRNGEPIPRLPLQFEFKLWGLKQSRSVRLATGPDGEIDLGPLFGVERFWVSGAQMPRREFPVHRPSYDWPQKIHAHPSDTIRVSGPMGTVNMVGTKVGVEALDRELIDAQFALRGVRRFSLMEVRSGVVVHDRTEKLQVLPGHLQIEGLEPGSYTLIDHDRATSIEIEIVAGEKRDDWIVGKSRTVNKTTTQGLLINRVALVEGNLQVDLSGIDEATRLLVVASPYAHGETDGWLRRTQRSFAPILRRDRIPSFFVDSLKLDEEYQYVLARQQSAKFLGSTLAHPTILLNPWELAATRNESQLAQGGDAIAERGAAAAKAAPAPSPATAAAPGAVEGNSRDYGFLAIGTRILANVRPDAQGRVVLDAKEFEGLTDVAVVAIAPNRTATVRIGLPWQGPRKLADRRLPEAFDRDKHFIQKESVLSIGADQATDLGDVGVTRIRVYNSIRELVPLMDSILQGSEQFSRFDFLKNWSKLSDADKEAKFSEFACHEFHLFLLKHDSAFFERVVRPHLLNKSPRQFIDDWILNQPIDAYGAPWRYQQLNTLERVLLAQRIPERKEGLIRLFENQVTAQPVPIATQNAWFFKALRTSELEIEDNLSVESLSFYDRRLGETEGKMQDSISGKPGSQPAGPESYGFGRGKGDPRPSGSGGPGGGRGNMGGLGGMGGGGMGGGAMAGKALADGGEQNMLRKLNRAEEKQSGSDKDRAGEVPRFGVEVDSLSRDAEESLADAPADAAGALKAEVSELGRLGVSRRRAGDNGKRVQLFEPLGATRKWAESQFDKVVLANQNPALVTPNLFWVDVLKQPEGVLSQHLHTAARNSNEALLALCFVDLPLDSAPGNLEIENGRWIYKHNGKSLVYVQGIVSIPKGEELKDDDSKILLNENFYLASADTTSKPVRRQEMVIGVPYRGRVVLTNPTGNPMQVQVLMQIPQGAIPIEGGRSVTVREFQLAPFSTQETSHVFYFPTAGEFQHYGARASSEGRYLAHVDSNPVKVLDAPLSVDDTSWPYLAAWGSNEQVLAALDRANLAKIDLGLIAWRMKDREFWSSVLNKLDRVGIYQPVLWGYSLVHTEPNRIREFLEAQDMIVQTVSPYLDTAVMHVDLESRLRYEHLDFRPIVVARTHRLGREWKILNDGLAVQYRELLNLLSYQPKILPRQRLSLVYYQLIQNRIEEAFANFKRIDRASLITGTNTTEAQMQYDYFDAVFAMRTGEFDRADGIAKKYEAYPVPRWNEWFRTVADQIRERKALQAGMVAANTNQDPADAPDADPSFANDAQRELEGGREAALERSAAKLPGLELVQKDGQLWIQHRNLKQVQIHYYFVDVELMYSRNPFLGQSRSGAAVIEPNAKKTIEVETKPTWERLEWKIPEEFKNRNLILEVVSGGIVRSVPIYSSSLTVNLSVPVGRLQVLKGSDKHPMEGAYVKVYAKQPNGSVRFYKDGYTDLRGVFDYASLSTDEWKTVTRYSILVLHPDYGAWIQECDPPTR